MTSSARAPHLALTAVGSRRTLTLDSPGVTLVLISFAQETQTGIEAIEEAVRERWPLATDVLVAHVVDLKKVPSLFRSVAERMLAAEHSKASDALQSGLTPYDYVVILPDWQGAFAPALGLADTSESNAWAAISATGAVLATGLAGDLDRLITALAEALHKG